MLNRFSSWAPVALYMAGIFYLSSQPVLPTPVSLLRINDKMLHAIVYAGLSLLVLRACRRENMRYAAYIAIMTTIVYGVTDEIHQSFVPGRVMDAWDGVADAVGSLVVLIRHRL
ncbi:VanZ family protein [Candidatus Woesearchaeota archaeon]|nr:VanZ family protein [Candidatus Woesearchaeota archaeon]